MNPSNVRNICAAVPLAFLGVIWLIFQPAGSWGFAFLLCAVIASSGILALFYGGAASRMAGGVIGIMFLVGSIGVAARGSFNNEALKSLSQVIPPYESNIEYIEEKSNHPALRKGQVIWRIKTSDSPSKVRSFYANAANLAGWELRDDKKSIVLAKDGAILVIKPESSSGVTSVIYDYKAKP